MSSTELATNEDYSFMDTQYRQNMNEFGLEMEKISSDPLQEQDDQKMKVSLSDVPVEEEEENKEEVSIKVIAETNLNQRKRSKFQRQNSKQWVINYQLGDYW